MLVRVAKQAKAASFNFDGCDGCHICQAIDPLNYIELNGGRTPQEKKTHKQRGNNQLIYSESKDDDDDEMFMDSDQA